MNGIDYNILMVLGLALFLATAAGRLLSGFRVPNAIVCIVTGILLGRAGAGLLDESALEVLQPLNYFALGLIGFVVGGELKTEVLRKYGRSLAHILFFGGIGSFAAVFIFTFAAGWFLLGDLKLILAVSLILGAVASSTSPATQTSIIWETRSRGPLTTNILGMTALSDALAILLFALASSAAARISGLSSGGHTVLTAGYEIVGAALCGILAGFFFSKVIDRNPGGEMTAGISFGLILLLTGLCITFGFDMILALMIFGFVLVNLRPKRSNRVFKLTEQAVQPVFVLFFVILGASLDLVHFSLVPGFLVVFYLIGIAAGRFSGIRLGARLSGAPGSVRRYLPYSLFPQGGIAVALTVLAVQDFPGEIASLLVGTVTPAVLVLQVFGPLLTRNSLKKAGETGLNVTEDDILENVKVSEILDREPVFVYEDTTIPEVLKLFSSGDDLYYPVVSGDRKLLGIISVEGIKYTLMEQELGAFLLVFDIMEPVPVKINEDVFLSDVKEIMESYQIDFVPVVDSENILRGFIEKRTLRRFISSRLFELKKRMTSLDSEIR